MANIKYQKQIRKYSDDGGLTWNTLYDQGKPVYQVGDVIKSPSNCTSPDTYRLEWFLVPDAYICEEFDKYEIYVERESYDGKIWTNTGKRRKGNLIEANSEDCGYKPIYQWVVDGFICTGVDKYAKEKEQKSLDNGLTWQDTGRTRKGKLIEENSEECGYVKNNILEFEFVRNSSCGANYTINNTKYTTYTSPYRVDIKKDLGVEKFTSAHEMLFQNCKESVNPDVIKITSIPDTSLVTDMSRMFLGNDQLTSLDLSSFDTSNVQSMTEMFEDCKKIASLDLSKFNTSLVTDMDNMFHGCESLTSLDLSNFNVSNLTSIVGMFSRCSNLTTINLSNWKLNENCDATFLFDECHSLKTIIMNDVDCATQQKILAELRVDILVKIKVISNVPCQKPFPTNVLCYEFSGPTTYFYINDVKHKKTSSPVIYYLGDEKITSAHNMFYGSNITNLLLMPETNNITTAASIFKDCSNLTSLDLSRWNVSNVTSLENAFAGCTSLANLNLDNWNLSSVENTYGTFYNCKKLKSIDLSKWNIPLNKNISYMFFGTALETADLSMWNVEKVTNISNIFSNCENLKSIDLSGWNLNSVVNIEEIVNETCTSLTNINVSNWNIPTTFRTGRSYTFGNISSSVVIDARGCNCRTLDILFGINNNYNLNVISDGSNCGDCTLRFKLWENTYNPRHDFELRINNKLYMLDERYFYGDGNKIHFEDTIRVVFDIDIITSAHQMFYQSKSDVYRPDDYSYNQLGEIFKIPDMSNCTDMSEMFKNNKFIRGNSSSLNTINVITMRQMYYNCHCLLNMYNMNTVNVQDMSQMLENCKWLLHTTELDLTSCEDIHNMFNGCTDLKEIIFKGDPKNITNLTNAFGDSVENKLADNGTMWIDSKYNYDAIINELHRFNPTWQVK